MIFPVKHLPQVIPIGIQTENGVESIGFDVKPWLDAYGDLTLSVWPTRPGENAAYRVADQNMELIGTVLFWHPVTTDTAIPGVGKVEILGMSGDKRKLSGWCNTMIRETSLGSTQEPPEAARPWVEEVVAAAGKAENAVDKMPSIGESGNWLLWNPDNEHYEDSGYPSRGQNGDTRVFVGTQFPPEEAEVWINPQGMVDGDDLPTASHNQKGAVVVGKGLVMNGDVLNAEVTKADLEEIDIDFGTGNAGKLVYIGSDGKMTPLVVGYGLTIANGVLRVTGSQVVRAICGSFRSGEAICGEV